MDKATLMMALLIASPTLAGLAAVLMGQLAQASSQKGKRVGGWEIKTLLASITFCIGVVICTIIGCATGSIVFFALQIAALVLVVYIMFWGH